MATNAILHVSATNGISNAWYLKTVSKMNKITTFFSEISQQTFKIYDFFYIITQIWNRAKLYFTCISGPWYLIMVPNIKKIHSAVIKECARMDERMGPVPILFDSENNKL